MRAPPPCSDDVIERAFCDADVVRDAWTTAARLAPEACRVEQTAASPEAALPAIVRFLGERGLLGLCVPSAFGGASESVRSIALCLARERLGHASPLVELAFAMQALGSYPITARGSEAQKSEWLPGVAAGELVAAFALTEPEAGSDLGGIETVAKREGDHYVLTGEKILISNAGIASFYVVFAATADKGEKVGPSASGTPAREKRRLSAFVVDAKSPGLETKPTRVLGGHPIGSVYFEGVRVPARQRLGDEGDGLAIAMETLHKLRPTVGAAAIGFAQRALDETVRHVRSRKQFGAPLAEQQAVQMHLADMALDVESARLLVYRAAAFADVVDAIRRSGGGRESDAQRAQLGKTASMGKLAATEAASRVIDMAVQLHGGRGVVHGSAVARLYEDVRALRIYEGASDVQRLLIARDLLRE